MDAQPFGNMVMKVSPDTPVLASSHSEFPAMQLKAEEQDCLTSSHEKEEEKEEML